MSIALIAWIISACSAFDFFILGVRASDICRDTHEQYPNLIPAGQSVPTIANATILAVYAWPENTDRYRKVANFVNRFFGSIDKFTLEPRHPRWREINLAAEVPGWTRFKAAQQWLDNNNSALKNVSSIRPAFEKFVQGTDFNWSSQEAAPKMA